MGVKLSQRWRRLQVHYTQFPSFSRITIISGTGAAICTAVVVAIVILAYLESVYKISRSWADVLTFYGLLLGVVYLTWWDFAIDPTASVHQILCKYRKVRRRPWQWLDKCLGKKAWTVHGNSTLTETENGETGEEQSQDHVHHFIWSQGYCTQRIRPDRPNSQLCIDAWKCVRTSPRILATKEQAAVSWQRTVSHLLFTREFLTKNNMTAAPTNLFFFVSPIEDKTERRPFWHKWGDRIRIAGGAEHSHRTRLPGCILKKTAEWLGTVHTHGRGLLRGWWWLAGPKLASDQMAVSFPEAMDCSL
jgi:hypothetical protein